MSHLSKQGRVPCLRVEGAVIFAARTVPRRWNNVSFRCGLIRGPKMDLPPRRALLLLLVLVAVLAGSARASNFSLDDLTPDEMAVLEAELLQVYNKELSENNTDGEESKKEDDEPTSPEEAMASLNDMMADLFEKAMASKAMKEIIRKRVAESNFEDMMGSGEEEEKENENKEGDKEEGEQNEEGETPSPGEKDEL